MTADRPPAHGDLVQSVDDDVCFRRAPDKRVTSVIQINPGRILP